MNRIYLHADADEQRQKSSLFLEFLLLIEVFSLLTIGFRCGVPAALLVNIRNVTKSLLSTMK